MISASRLDESQGLVDVASAQQSSAQALVQANADAGTEVVQAQARLAQAKVVALANARVLTRQMEPGQIVQLGKALMSLALAGPSQLVAQVDEQLLEQLRLGQRTTVVADAFPA